MRHRKGGNQLGRNSSHRRAMLKNMVTALFKYEQIETTDAKAKVLRAVAEKMITLGKRGDLHARRQALAYIKDKEITYRLFGDLKDRYLDRTGGYIRIIKKDTRKGDGAPISIIQLIPQEEGKKSRKKGNRPSGSKGLGKKSIKETLMKKREKKVEKELNKKSSNETDDVSDGKEKKI